MPAPDQGLQDGQSWAESLTWQIARKDAIIILPIYFATT